MNVDLEIKNLIEANKRNHEKIRWLRKHRAQLEPVPLQGQMYGDHNVDFNLLPHADVIKVIRAVGGKWKKTLNTSADKKPRIDYETEVDGYRIRCWAGEPPPTCRLVEVEEEIPEQVIPAHKIKKVKMVCTGQAEPVAVALARANNPQPQQ